MSKGTYPLKLPASVKSAATRLAREDGVSLNQWISVAVAQKVGAVETAADFFGKLRARAAPGDFLRILENAPDVEPEENDRLPDGYR